MRYISITNSQNRIVIDDEDFEKLKLFSWSINKKGALQTTINYKVCSMPNIIFNNDMMYDHKNNDMLDNQKGNLRISTYQQNNANRKKFKGRYSSKFKGVTYRSKVNKYEAQIEFNKKSVYLGRFNKEANAAIAYNQAAVRYFGEFASLNII